MQANKFADVLARLLAQTGAALTESAVRRATKDCRDEIYADSVAHAGHIEDHFFNVVASKGTAVFTFFESQFSVYVLRCNEAQLISEVNRFAMEDTEECKAFLSAQYGKVNPDCVVPRAVCEHWLDGG